MIIHYSWKKSENFTLPSGLLFWRVILLAGVSTVFMPSRLICYIISVPRTVPDQLCFSWWTSSSSGFPWSPRFDSSTCLCFIISFFTCESGLFGFWGTKHVPTGIKQYWETSTVDHFWSMTSRKPDKQNHPAGFAGSAISQHQPINYIPCENKKWLFRNLLIFMY